MPYFAGLLGIHCRNLHLPRKGTSCSSIVTHSLGMKLGLQLSKNNFHTFVNAAMCSVSSLECLVLLSSNLKYLRISSNLPILIAALYIGFCVRSQNSSRAGTSQLFSTPARRTKPMNARSSSLSTALQVFCAGLLLFDPLSWCSVELLQQYCKK